MSFRLRKFSLVLFVFSFFVGIQFVSFVWLNSKGKTINYFQGFQHPIHNNSHNGSSMRSPKETPSFIPKESPKITNDEAMRTETKSPQRTTTLRQTSPSTTTSNNSKISPPTAKTIDMENEYHPLVNFSFVWPETTPDLKGERDFFLVVLVNSAAKGKKYRARRNAIRKTWANMTNCEHSKMKQNPTLQQLRWILVFSLGKADDPGENEANAEESKNHNDLLIGDFLDHYLNNVVKVFMGELWVSTMNVRYILKTDDDVYVRIPSVIEWIVVQNYPSSFYGGAPYFNFKVDRNPNGKWAVSKRYFEEDIFPPFCAGAFYVLSTDILSKMFNYVRRRKPFHTDDAYVGIAARDLSIPVKRIPGLLLEDNMPIFLGSFNDCRLLQARGFGHSIEPPLMNAVFNRLDELCVRNATC
ncbi:UDP-GalNAc:beta-1,3-N-acetylgalactosaminyltransferase 1-like [Actinia tenebrosa]|uniref:Hexosyltransferase n=1 Tax=Actinia tenebrosa TaxID=6105 RepID=A0A6P8ISW8_ACTTE|nr:UDP-GalNAc:beta-1,3-N-acetylgalactosaminyltransferase 1-like [Actinia tenebrosa]